jgi:hypothetical protein
MASKRSKKDKRSSKKQPPQPETQEKKWRNILILVTVTPLGIGLLLIFLAMFEIVWWVSVPAQALLGGYLILASFVLFNALQYHWGLAAGWLLFGTAIWIWLNWIDTPYRFIAYLVGAAGLVLLGKEFVQRYREQQSQVKK